MGRSTKQEIIKACWTGNGSRSAHLIQDVLAEPALPLRQSHVEGLGMKVIGVSKARLILLPKTCACFHLKQVYASCLPNLKSDVAHLSHIY